MESNLEDHLSVWFSSSVGKLYKEVWFKETLLRIVHYKCQPAICIISSELQ